MMVWFCNKCCKMQPPSELPTLHACSTCSMLCTYNIQLLNVWFHFGISCEHFPCQKMVDVDVGGHRLEKLLPEHGMLLNSAERWYDDIECLNQACHRLPGDSTHFIRSISIWSTTTYKYDSGMTPVFSTSYVESGRTVTRLSTCDHDMHDKSRARSPPCTPSS